MIEGHTLGISSDSDRILVEFIDYECSVCGEQHEIIHAHTAAGEFAVVYKHFPLSIHPRASGAAGAAICADEQGEFASMHNRLYEDRRWIAEVDVSTLARDIGLDIARFDACMTAPSTTKRIEADLELARTLGLQGTPTFVTRDGLRYGLQTLDQLRDAVR